LGSNSLTARGIIEHEVIPRRATVHNERILSLSGNELLSVNAADRDHPLVTGQLDLAWSINRVLLAGDYLIEVSAVNGWDESGKPTLRVAPALSPDHVLATLTLSDAPVAGASIRSNRLYVVQAQNDGAIVDSNLPPYSIQLTVLDLSNLPALNILGHATVATTSLGWNSELEPLWLRPGLLLWSGGANHYWWGPWDLLGPRDFIGGLWFWPYWPSSGGGRLFAFDVADDAAPSLLSEVNLTTNGWWNFSQAFAADGRVYLSHQARVVPGTNDSSSVYSKYFLDVVDYADPRHPSVRPPVNIPGTLQGTSHNGSLLYTVGFHVTSTNSYSGFDALDASAYDGVAAYLVDSISLSNTWQHPVLLSGSNVFLGRDQYYQSSTNIVPARLETWTLSDNGKFTLQGSLTLTESASDLVSFPGLLAAQLGSAQALVFDLSNPAALRKVGEGPLTGCIYFDLDHADAAPARALWLPLDAYGVTKIDLTP
jgi:hypothetical protein